ncbi:MAG: sialidase family protein [Kiritimatiellaeota bacterium]|nr:sialidase family protein [Kiritimatiellota bacterium]
MRIVEAGILNHCTPRTSRAILTFPSLVSLSNGGLLGVCRSGSTKDTDDETIEVCESHDNGHTWSAPHRPFATPALNGLRGSLKVGYITELESGHLLAGVMWIDRTTYPGQPLFNTETNGCLPMTILLADSHDFGATWSAWRSVPMPEEIGPPSLTNPILKLKDGTLAMSIETNKNYRDRSPWRQQVVLLHSADQGKTWGPPKIAGFDQTGRIFNWDQRAGVAPDGRIVTFLWTYDTQAKAYLNIHRRISLDGGRTWSHAEDIGMTDQASHPAILPDGRVVLAWVDRFKTHSIRARLAPAIDRAFDPASEVIIYTPEHASAGNTDAAGALGMSIWSFGLPYAEALPGGDVLALYYAGTDTAMDMRYARLSP